MSLNIIMKCGHYLKDVQKTSFREKEVDSPSFGQHNQPKPEHSLPKLPPADEEDKMKIWSSYSNCLDPEKRVPLRQDGIGDLQSRI